MSCNYLFMLYYLIVLVYSNNHPTQCCWLVAEISSPLRAQLCKYTPLVAPSKREELLLNTPHRLIWEMTQPGVTKLNLHLAGSKHLFRAFETELN